MLAAIKHTSVDHDIRTNPTSFTLKIQVILHSDKYNIKQIPSQPSITSQKQ